MLQPVKWQSQTIISNMDLDLRCQHDPPDLYYTNGHVLWMGLGSNVFYCAHALMWSKAGPKTTPHICGILSALSFIF